MQFEKENTLHGQLYNSWGGGIWGCFERRNDDGSTTTVVPEQAIPDEVVRWGVEQSCKRTDLHANHRVVIEFTSDWIPQDKQEKLESMRRRWAHDGMMTPYSEEILEEFKERGMSDEKINELVDSRIRLMYFSLADLAELEARQLARQREDILAYWASKGVTRD